MGVSSNPELARGDENAGFKERGEWSDAGKQAEMETKMIGRPITPLAPGTPAVALPRSQTSVIAETSSSNRRSQPHSHPPVGCAIMDMVPVSPAAPLDRRESSPEVTFVGAESKTPPSVRRKQKGKDGRGKIYYKVNA